MHETYELETVFERLLRNWSKWQDEYASQGIDCLEGETRENRDAKYLPSDDDREENIDQPWRK